MESTSSTSVTDGRRFKERLMRYNHGDIIRITATAPKIYRPGEKGWIVGWREVPGKIQSPSSIVIQIEYEDGSDMEVPEELVDSFN
jgi:hypothetical protein